MKENHRDLFTDEEVSDMTMGEKKLMFLV